MKDRPGGFAAGRRRWRIALPIVLPWLLTACAGPRTLERRLIEPDDVAILDDRVSPYLKAHMHDGDVYVLHDWRVNDVPRTVSGTGNRYDRDRVLVESGPFTLPIEAVAIFETNELKPSPVIAPLAIITGISVAVTIYCASNPKACFGSCPTFYTRVGSEDALVAEGFSSSIAPSLEEADVDALYRVRSEERRLRIEMRNEALETHVVRHVDLLAVARPPGGRVLALGGGGFRGVTELHAPVRARAGEGDVRAAVASLDGVERTSVTDPDDLGARETIELEFDVASPERLGLVVGARQSLLSTYLLYQMLAYMGSDVGDWMARFERSGGGARVGPFSRLGTIEIQVEDGAGEWLAVGRLGETGPLATDVNVLPLPVLSPGPLRVRVVATRGLWRFDWIALATLDDEIEPLRVRPTSVTSASGDDRLASLLDSTRVLTTLPGDVYAIEYDLPHDPGSYELFLESRGYYLEWIRDEWVEEEDPARLARMLFAPAEALEELAPEFKRVEPELENAFWRSRYARP